MNASSAKCNKTKYDCIKFKPLLKDRDKSRVISHYTCRDRNRKYGKPQPYPRHQRTEFKAGKKSWNFKDKILTGKSGRDQRNLLFTDRTARESFEVGAFITQDIPLNIR